LVLPDPEDAASNTLELDELWSFVLLFLHRYNTEWAILLK
jgi:hypothetical protein